MRALGILFFLLFIFYGIKASPLIDTVKINSTNVNAQIMMAQIAVGDDLSINAINESMFSDTLLPFKTKSSVILRKQIIHQDTNPIEVIIEPAGFHYVDVILKNQSSGKSILKKTGRLVGYPSNELVKIRAASNKVRFSLEPNTSYELTVFYLNPKKEKIHIDLAITEYKTWLNTTKIQQRPFDFWHGLFFGTLILLSLINFIFYYLFRDRTYMVYVGYIIMIVVYETLTWGFFDNTWLANYPLFVFILKNTTLILFIIFYLFFLRDFLDVRQNYPKWNQVLIYLSIYLVFHAIVSDAIFYSGRILFAFDYRNFGMLIVLPIATFFLFKVLFSKRLIDKIFFSGSIILVISGFVSIIESFIDKSGNSDLYLQIGILIELIIFNIGLGMRSKVIQKEKDEELLELISKLKESEEKQISLNANLEQKVTERTQQINDINAELVTQRDQLFKQNETIEQNLDELNNVRKSLVHTVYEKTKELRKANKELVAQNAQLEQYAFITAHNLKAPVARLKGLVNIFELTSQPTDPGNELISRIKEASLDMDEVISDINKILQIKNFNQQDRKITNLNLLIEKIKKRLEDRINENKVDLSANLEIDAIHSIDTYLESILYNLIYNGVKYCRDDIDSQIQIHSYQRRNRVYVDVSDNGIGIDLDRYGKKIFGLYQRFHDHVNGKGIGLYLVKTQVEALQGKISIESKVNEGTTFTLSFPTL